MFVARNDLTKCADRTHCATITSTWKLQLYTSALLPSEITDGLIWRQERLFLRHIKCVTCRISSIIVETFWCRGPRGYYYHCLHPHKAAFRASGWTSAAVHFTPTALPQLWEKMHLSWDRASAAFLMNSPLDPQTYIHKWSVFPPFSYR